MSTATSLLTMNRPSRPNRSEWWPYLIGGLLLVLLFFGNLFQAPLGRAATALVHPLWDVQTIAAARLTVLTAPLRKSAAGLERENQLLRQALEAREADIAVLAATAEENAALRAAAGYLPGPSQPLLARVVSPEQGALTGVLTIDRGRDTSDARLAVGSIVFVGPNIAAGRVTEVYGSLSKILLWSAPGQTLPVFVGAARVPAEAVGRGSGNYTLQVPPGAPVAPGDIVTTSVAPGTVVGVVGKVEHDEAEPFATVFFRSPVTIKGLEWVVIDGRI